MHLGHTGDVVYSGCNADLQKQIDYLGPIDFMIYHTEDLFREKFYDE